MAQYINKILCGDAAEVLKTLPEDSVQCCVTSPPYYGLRDYGAAGQLGLESDVDDYLNKLLAIFDEVHRVLKPDGVLWVNIADSYAGSGKGGAKDPSNAAKYKQGSNKGSCASAKIAKIKSSLPAKNLMLVPQRFVIRMQSAGWIVRDDIIYEKANPMPESVKDRLTNSYEHIYMFAKNKKYYFNAEAATEAAIGFNNDPIAGSKGALGNLQTRRRRLNYNLKNIESKTGLRKMRNVWKMSTASGKSSIHYARFPDELARRCITLSSHEGDLILDPFVGSGTTCRVASRYGRYYIGIDINADYCAAAMRNIPESLF